MIVYEQKEDTSSAIAEYKKGIDADPNNFLALNQLAWVYAEQGDHLDEALAFAQKAASLSASPGVVDTLGWVFYKRGEYAQAVEQFEQALKTWLTSVFFSVIIVLLLITLPIAFGILASEFTPLIVLGSIQPMATSLILTAPINLLGCFLGQVMRNQLI